MAAIWRGACASLIMITIFSCAVMNEKLTNFQGDLQVEGPEIIATGLHHPEGPMIGPDGALYFVEFRAQPVWRKAPGKPAETLFTTGMWHCSMIFDSKGAMYLSAWRAKQVLRRDLDGTVSVVTTTCGRDSLNGPNDFAWGPGGRLYFTDPFNTSSKNPSGKVCYIEPDGTTKTFAGGLAFPNGIAFNNDQTCCYVGDNHRHRILIYKVDANGIALSMRVFHQFSDDETPDGFKLDVKGNLWVSLWDGGKLICLNPDGKRILDIPLPGEDPHATNVYIGGPDGRDAYVTIRNGENNGLVVKYRLPFRGVSVY